MKKKPRQILPAALLLSAALHLLAYGSFIAYLGRPAESVRPGEGDSPAGYIEIGLVAAAAPAPDLETVADPAPAAAVESEIKTALLSLPDPSPVGDREPEAVPAPEGRAGREEVTAGPAVDDYLGQVRQQIIEAATTYPRRARLSRLEGTVRVGFLIGPTGALRESRLLEPSPHGLFNRAARDILERAAPFPPPVPGIEGRLISVPITFESIY